ncbi:alpha-D-ribose 1-methylphosphonate 5-triphosphate diphosphatase [Aureimonas altamirensis]|uniref:alpha-D-ribose 1-methylphosphonate 5-triphosphate diphosphatase n=1 Tax=Aureimonas altamirensis TaxID=370622 RepID=UPI002036BD7E|nr:alpha-D-ribose 1-methylphosphonate 5-triphosphate diphosphatase [Aureimonas altamirensis]
MTQETVMRNARIVLRDRIVHGAVQIRDGRIADISDGAAHGEDLGGDTLVPGCVELHTDHVESHFVPRPKVRWNIMAALQAHDAQIAASGITTVFDALRVGLDGDTELKGEDAREMAGAIGAAMDAGRLRADHYIHLRCEVSVPDVVDEFDAIAGNERVRLASLMDHAPLQRQFVSLDAYKTYYQGKRRMSDADFQRFCDRRLAESASFAAPNRRSLAARCRERAIPIASHDDATAEHVAEGVELGIRLAEFPTTREAARLSHEAGMSVLMGAPNVVRGRSHSGNISARDLVETGHLDILSSDYVPFSLLQAAFLLAEDDIMSLPDAIALVTDTPAKAAGMNDRGRLAPGLRADMVRIRTMQGEPPIVAGVWREGLRVA